MKIAFVSTNDVAPWGGSEELWYQSAKRFKEEGYDVAINIKKWTNDPPAIKELEVLNCLVTKRNKRYYRITLADRLNRRLKSLIANRPANIYTEFYQWLSQVKPDFVIVSLEMNISGYSYMKACLNAQIPFIIIIQSASEIFWPGEKSSLNLLEVYTKAKACFFVSLGNLRLTEKQLACTLANAHIVRNPFNVSYHVPFNWPEESVYQLACVGRLDLFAKGQDLIFEVLNTEKWKNRNIRINLYGKGSNQQSLERLQELWNLQNFIYFAGFVSNIEEIWGTNHALILPSRFEGLPIAVVEAMLCGRMCIVTDIAGNGELLKNNETGFIAAAPNAKALDEAMERAWQNRQLWKQMGMQAYKEIRNKIPEFPALAFNELVKRLFYSQ